MTHPLTDEISLAIDDNSMIDEDDWKGYMRAGADWQLEQVIEWLNETIFERGCSFEAVNIPEELAQAMRPQENN